MAEPKFKVGDYVAVELRLSDSLTQIWATGMSGEVLEVKNSGIGELTTPYYIIDSDTNRWGIWEYNLVSADSPDDAIERAWEKYKEHYLLESRAHNHRQLRKRDFINGYRTAMGLDYKF